MRPCSADNGCVEVAWRRPVDCSANNCVEVAPVDGRWLIRDGKLGDSSPVLEFTPDEMAAFVAAVREEPARYGG